MRRLLFAAIAMFMCLQSFCAQAATLDNASAVNYENFNLFSEEQQNNILHSFAEVPEEVVLLQKEKGGTLDFVTDIDPVYHFHHSVEQKNVIGVYDHSKNKIELKCDPEQYTRTDAYIALTHEYGHFVYELVKNRLPKSLRETFKDLHFDMKEKHEDICYNETETFAVVYSNLKQYEADLKTEQEQPAVYQISEITNDMFLQKYKGIFDEAENIATQIYLNGEEEPQQGPGTAQASPKWQWSWEDKDDDGVYECYCYTLSGTLVRTSTIENFAVDEKGRWVENGKVQTKTEEEVQKNEDNH